MDELKERLRDVEGFTPPDLWWEITSRRSRPLPSEPRPGRRIAVALLALAVAVAGFAIVSRAFVSRAFRSAIDLASSPPVADSSNAIVAMASGRGIPALDGAEIVRIDPMSGGVTQLTHAGDEGRSAMSPAWSPDGDRIAFVRDQGAAISVVDLATGSVKDVYVPKAHQIVQLPSWSPDGSRIAFQMGPESVDIYTVDASTGDLTRLTDDGDSGYPAWSPDGSRIAFRRGDNIWVMSANGSGPRRITTCTLPCVDSFSPVWSLDSTTLAFVRQGDGGASLQLFKIGIDGSNLHQITSGQTMYSNPSWRPGGRG